MKTNTLIFYWNKVNSSLFPSSAIANCIHYVFLTGAINQCAWESGVRCGEAGERGTLEGAFFSLQNGIQTKLPVSLEQAAQSSPF